MCNVVPLRAMLEKADAAQASDQLEPAAIVRAAITDTRQLLEQGKVSRQTACQGLERVRAHVAGMGATPDALADLQALILELGDASGRG